VAQGERKVAQGGCKVGARWRKVDAR
jgi:hypothetical protein